MFRKTAALFALTLGLGLTASADFSYTNTQKVTGGSMGAMAGTAADRTSKYYFKGQRMITSTGDTTTIVDFGKQTVTTLNNPQKTYTVKKFGELADSSVNTDMSVDVKDTGQKKVVNGFSASEQIVTMNVDVDMGRGGPTMKMQVEMDMWVSADVPGAGEMRTFYQKNAANFPWSAVVGGGNPGMLKAMAQVQRKMTDVNGVVVEQVIRIKQAAGAQMAQMPQMPQMSPAQQAQMQAAMAKLQAMQQQGGPGATAAQQAMASMGGMARGGTAGGSSGSLIEMTVQGSGFSDASVPDSVFAIPDGYKQSQ